MTYDEQPSNELIEMARVVCFEKCQAIACEWANECTNNIYGNGSGCWFHINFPEARRRLEKAKLK